MFDSFEFESIEKSVDIEYETYVKKMCEAAGSCGDCFACLSEYPEQCEGPDYNWNNEDD